MPPDQRTHKRAIWLLRRGSLAMADIARELDVSRQTLRYWAQTAGFDYRARRAAYIRRRMREAKRNNK